MMRLDVRGATDHLTRITGKSPLPNVCFHWSCPPAPARRPKIELRRSPEMFVQAGFRESRTRASAALWGGFRRLQTTYASGIGMRLITLGLRLEF
jgi:hypothetical protein